MTVLPFILLIGGLVAAIFGLVQWSSHRGNYGYEMHASTGLSIMIIGILCLIGGLVWLFLSPASFETLLDSL